jgi:threonine/homoserine/homoserine lactone efflux protein
MLEISIKGFLVGLLASMPVGPIGVIIIQRTISRGRWPGMMSGFGAATADTFYAIIAGLGLSFIIKFMEAQQFWFKILGGGLLIFLGIRMFLTNPVKDIRDRHKKKHKHFEDFISVFVLTISNPLYIIIFIAMFAGVGLVNNRTEYLHVFVAFAAVFIGASLWWFILVSVFGYFRTKIRLKRIWWLNKITGAVIVVLGILVFFSLMKQYNF